MGASAAGHIAVFHGLADPGILRLKIVVLLSPW